MKMKKKKICEEKSRDRFLMLHTREKAKEKSVIRQATVMAGWLEQQQSWQGD